MSRLLVSLGLASLMVVQVATTAQADRKAKRRGQNQEAPTSGAIEKDLGDMKWGMSMREVVGKFQKDIEDSYRPKIAKERSAVKEDQLRSKMRGEIKKLHDSAVRFNGEKTGWDVSFLKGEFTHHNNEALVVYEGDRSKTFYFFIGDRLWKVYKAFDASVFSGADFAEFANAVQGRYGQGKKVEGEATPGEGKRQWLEWQDQQTRLRAVDQTSFYGFYCLVFEDKATLRRLPELRRHKDKNAGGTHSLVEHVTSGEASSADGNQDVLDRITGRIRHRQDAPKGSGAGSSSSSSKGSNAPPPAESAPPPTLREEDDPLRGLF